MSKNRIFRCLPAAPYVKDEDEKFIAEFIQNAFVK